MRVLLLTDELFAVREQSLLMRLEVGLADEGVRIVHAIPEAATAFHSGDLISRGITYPKSHFRFTLGSTARAIIRSLANLSTSEDWEDVDLIHVFGGGAWNLGAALARELEAPMLLEVWRQGLVPRSFNVAASQNPPPTFMAPDSAIEKALRAEPAQLVVRSAPWGVLTPSTFSTRLPDDRAISAMLIGTGRDRAAFAAALEGIALAVKAGHDIMVFCDSVAARRAHLWQYAKTLGILDRLSLIPELEGRRDLVLQGDLLLQPDATGEQRSITLEGMAGAMIVIAASDPAVSAVQDGRTARVVPRPEARLWAEILSDVLADRDRARRLGMEARRFVAEHRRASDHVRAVLEAYTLATRGDAIPFKPLAKT